MSNSNEIQSWLSEQVSEFGRVRHKYESFARVLGVLLEHIVKPVSQVAIVQARAKAVASFASKCVRKWPDRKYPVNDLTDLAGGRVLLQLQTEVDELSEGIARHFIVLERENVTERLAAAEFGYGSVHFIVKIDPDRMPTDLLIDERPRSREQKRVIPKKDIDNCIELKGEVQLRTFAQHVSADFGHDRFYKSNFIVPRFWQRGAAQIAAQLETVDNMLLQIVAGMRSLETNVGTFLPKDAARDEIRRLEAVLQFDKKNTFIINRIARLYMSLGEYQNAIEAIKNFIGEYDFDLHSNYGYSLCLLHRDRQTSRQYNRGRKMLQAVADQDPKHAEALTRLAETFGGSDADRASLYKAAYESAPWEPRALSGFLVHQLATTKDRSMVQLLRPAIDEAVGVCQAQLDAKINLPDALIHQSLLQLVADEPMEALDSLCRALSLTRDPLLMAEVRDRFAKLRRVQPPVAGLGWCVDVLQLAASVHGKLDPQIKKRAISKKRSKPIVIVAGGCDPRHEEHVQKYNDLLKFAFVDFEGTIISGGTQQGISGIVGEIIAEANRSGREVHGVSYLPPKLPSDGSATRDDRYNEFPPMKDEDVEAFHARETLDSAFSPTQGIQVWVDIIASGLAPADATLIGVDGGTISRFEFRLAAAMGAKVALIAGSGRAVDEIVKAPHVPGNERITIMPADPWTLREFLREGDSCWLTDKQVDTLTPQIDREYHKKNAEQRETDRKQQISKSVDLANAFRNSNREQACHIPAKVRQLAQHRGIQLSIVPIDDDRRRYTLTDEDVQFWAEIEHGRWNVERLLKGWVLGERDDDAHNRKSLVAWRDLSEKDKDLDRHAVGVIPELLQRIGCKIVEISKSRD